MRPILVLMLALAGVAGALGLPMLFTGTWLLGGSLSLAAIGVAWYALRTAEVEATHQREYDQLYRERIDAYTEELRLNHFNSWRQP